MLVVASWNFFDEWEGYAMSAGSTDRNLLLGILALQNNFINREALLGAFNVWVEGKDQSIGDLLRRQGKLKGPQLELLNALVEEHLKQHGGSAERSLAAMSGIPQLQVELGQLRDPDLAASLMHLPPPSRPEPARHAETLGTVPYVGTESSRGTRFRILRPHAEGGLGTVSVAFDGELHREVALKEIKPRHADDMESRSRFIREAEITGGLEHPGIVPVYGLGNYGDGRPFYAMRFIRGDSLREAIEHYHKSRLTGDSSGGQGEQPSQPAPRETANSPRTVELRKLLQRFIDVCEAMEYAHSRGVLHRDLKPGNIMLGKYGETLVVDWGLARVGDAAESASTSDERKLVPGSAGSSTPTLYGSAIGTPSYMSPEQAAGRLDALGPASDVYSLGATLYAILTGKAPIEGRDLGEVLQRVQRGDYLRPRALSKEISPALEAVCLKALALEPADRYPSARELASDIEKWLADEPVSAFRESPLRRLGRWSRRHRAWVQAGGVALALITCVSIAAVVLINASRIEAQHQRGVADGERAKAVQLAAQEKAARIRAIQLAKENEQIALDKTRLASEEHKQRQMADQLAKDNEKLAQDERLEADKARKLSEFLIGTFQASDPVGLGGATFFIPHANSEKLTARQILDRGGERVKADPELAKFPLAKAAVMNAIGDVYRQLGLWEQAEPLLSEALTIRRAALPSEHPEVAESCHNLAYYYHERGDFDKANKLYREALGIRQKIPGKEGKQLTALTVHNLAWMLGNEHKSAEAEKLFREVLAIRRELYGDLHRDVVFSKLGIAFTLIEQGKSLQATPLVLEAKNELLKLEGNQHLSDAVTAFALGVIYRQTLGARAAQGQLEQAYKSANSGLGPDSIYVGLARYELAANLDALGRIDEAEEHYRACLKIAREQVQLQHPRLHVLINSLSRLLQRRGKAPEGAALWEEFVTAQRGRFGPDHQYTADAMYRQALYLKDTKQFPAAIPVFEEVANICRRNRTLERSLPNLATQLGLCYIGNNSDPVKAEECFREAIRLYQAQPNPGEQTLYDITIGRINLGDALMKQGKFDESQQELMAAQLAVEGLSGSDRKDAQDYLLIKLAALHRGTADHAQAVQASLERKKLWPRDPGELRSIAGELGECVNLLGDDPARLTPTEQKLREDYIAHTLQTLREAIAAGYKNKNSLATSKQFAAMREHADFQKLLAELK